LPAICTSLQQLSALASTRHDIVARHRASARRIKHSGNNIGA